MSDSNIPVSSPFDYVCEVPTYTELDYDYQQNWFANEFQNLHGGCSAAVKSINGETIIARNLDFNISNKSAYVVRTAVPGFHKTVGMCYVPWFGPDYKEAVTEGIPADFAKIVPFFCCDILNEKGFYIEANMRTEEYIDGKPRYKNYGLNPGGPRVSAIAFLRYAAERCATIDELLELLKEIDFYSLSAPGIEWGFAYVVADKTGNFGVLEIAGDKVYFNQYQGVQANMYVTPELGLNQQFRNGLGRYHTLMANYFKANSEQGMQDLIDLVKYSTQYSDMEHCAFDWRHEQYDPAQGIDYAMLTDATKQDLIRTEVEKYRDWWKSLSRQEKQDLNSIWESTLCTRTNVMQGTMRVRFYEDEERVLNLKVE
jgi:hypothetical protein